MVYGTPELVEIFCAVHCILSFIQMVSKHLLIICKSALDQRTYHGQPKKHHVVI